MITRELVLFLFVGCITALIDFATYHGLWAIGVDIDVAKGFGFLFGSALSYFANRFVTFGRAAHRPGSPLRFVMLYAATLAVNVITNALVWKLLREMRAGMGVAFVVATGLSASLNFVGMKRLVFNCSGAQEVQ